MVARRRSSFQRSTQCSTNTRSWFSRTRTSLLLLIGLFLCLPAYAQNQVIDVANGDVAGLISAINTLNYNGGGTIVLASGGQYIVSQPDNYWYGPNAFPAITSSILIVGGGATIVRASNAPKFRFFYVAGGYAAGVPAGSLTLSDLTLQNGLALGGNGGHGYAGGGGGAGMGGAIFNQGTLHVVRVQFSGNTAQGGSGGGGFGGAYGYGGGGGGGMGGNGGSSDNGYGAAGGGFRGNGSDGGYSAVPGGGFIANEGGNGCSGGTSTYGGNGAGSGQSENGGGGGGGFLVGENGGLSNGYTNTYPFFYYPGAGAQGGGNGGYGIGEWNGFCGGGGGAFGGGGSGAGIGGGGGGGVGGGGGGGTSGGGNGGFGGGGGSDGDYTGAGGFGGGGAGIYQFAAGGAGGFGAGHGAGFSYCCGGPGGGGAGMGGAIFNQLGTVIAGSDEFSSNHANGGGSGGSGAAGGQGLGGGIFNLDGTVAIFNASASPFGTATSGTDLYNVSHNGGDTAASQIPSAVTDIDGAAATSFNLVNTQVNGSATVNSSSAYAQAVLSGTRQNGLLQAVSFSNTALNSTQVTQLSVQNGATGNVLPLSISSVSLLGSPEFSLNTTCNGAVLNTGGGNCTIGVSFAPTQNGIVSGVLLVTDNAPDSPQTVYLTGVGGFPTVSVNPVAVSLSALLNQSSSSQVEVSNADSADPLSISAVQISSSNSFFTQTNNCLGVTIAPGGSCLLTVTFLPTAFGGDTGSITIVSNASNAPQVALVGQTLKSDQTITVTSGAPASGVFNANFNVAATASSGLPVTITGSGACSGNGSGNAAITMTSGTGVCTVTYSQAGNTDYNAASNVSQQVAAQKAVATVTLSNLSQTYNGTALSPSAITSPSGLSIVWSNAPQTHAGSYSVTATVSDSNYSGTATGTFVINKANVTVNVTPYNVTYDGNAHTATGTVTGVGGVSLAGLSLSATTHTNAGNYNDAWTFTDVTGNYNNASGSVNDIINKANATVNVTPYNVTYDGNAHTATGAVTGVSGVSLTGLSLTATTHTSAGTYNDAWTFTDATGNYNNASGSVSDIINKAHATVNVTPYNVTYDGNAHTATGTVTGVSGVSLTGLSLTATTHTSAGTYNDGWTFTDATGNYNNASGTVNDVINKANATVNVTPYSVTYDGNAHTATGTVTGVGGVSLTGLSLSATTHTSAGTYNDAWTFTDATGNYNNASGTVSDVINKANATVTVTPYSVTYDGSTHVASGTVVGVKGEPLSGLNLSGTAHVQAGDYPADPWAFTDVTGNYNNASGTVHDSIAKANPVLGWATPAAITYGTPLSGTQLNATANVPGSFTYTPAAGTILPIGTSTLSVQFSPTDAVDYTSASDQVSITVTVTYNSLAGQITASAGAITSSTTSLTSKVASAQAAIASGNLQAASGKLQAFIHQVSAMANAGQIAPGTAQALLAQAEYLLNHL